MNNEYIYNKLLHITEIKNVITLDRHTYTGESAELHVHVY